MLVEKYVFDLDNTLIYTDLLNNESYNYALKLSNLKSINNYQRITQDVVFSEYPYLKETQKKKIIELKQAYFINNLNRTTPNTLLLGFLKKQKPERCILWTSANKSRVVAILGHYNISRCFKSIVFSSKNNVIQDIDEICKIFKCSVEDLVFCEDDLYVLNEIHKVRKQI